MGNYAGVDWASEKHDVLVADAAGVRLLASGGATSEVVVLLTPEDIDAAAKLSVAYRPPGS